MNNAKAKKEAQTNTRTWGELKEIFDSADKSGPSSVNKGATKAQIAGIFSNYFNDKDLSVVPKGMAYSVRRNKEIMTSDALGISNLLREFG